MDGVNRYLATYRAMREVVARHRPAATPEAAAEIAWRLTELRLSVARRGILRLGPIEH